MSDFHTKTRRVIEEGVPFFSHMTMRARVGLALIASFVVLRGCEPSLEEIRDRGFSGVEQYTELKKFGKTYEAAIAHEDFLGDINDRGFEDLAAYEVLRPFGETFQEAIEAASVVSPSDLEDCEDDDYFRCFNKTGVWQVVVERYSSDGVHLSLRNDDCAVGNLHSANVDAINLSENFANRYMQTCIRVLVRVGDENLMTPDVTVLKLIDVEPEESTIARKKGFEGLESYKAFLDSGFADADAYRKARSIGLETPEQWQAYQQLQAEKRAAEREKIRQEYGCIPTVLVTYTCDYDPNRRRLVQHYCFPISKAEARDRVISGCENSIFHSRGGGATIHSVRDFL